MAKRSPKKVVAEGQESARKPPAGTMIRVSSEFSEALRDLTGLTGQSVAELADEMFLKAVRDRYRKLIIEKARQFESGGR